MWMSMNLAETKELLTFHKGELHSLSPWQHVIPDTEQN